MYGPFFLWCCCLADLLGSKLLNVAYIQNLQPQGAFIPLTKFNRFPLVPFPLPLSPSFSLSHSVSLLSYSEFNEGEEIKGSLWFAPDDGEACLFCFCWRSHTASIHVKWDFSFFPFFSSLLEEEKVIEMSEKEEPGSLEQEGSLQCQGSFPNIPWFFFIYFFLAGSLRLCGLLIRHLERKRGPVSTLAGLLSIVIIVCVCFCLVFLNHASLTPLTKEAWARTGESAKLMLFESLFIGY